MALWLSAAEARLVAGALRVLTSVHEFDSVDAWRAESAVAVRLAFGGERTLTQLPPCRATDAADAPAAACFAGEGVRPEVVARCEALVGAGPGSDDPARDVEIILGVCDRAGLDTWTGPSFVAEAVVPLGVAFDPRRSAFIRELVAPNGFWDGPHLRAHGRVGAHGYVAVLGTSVPRLRGSRTEDGTRVLAALLQPAFAAGVRMAVARWGRPPGAVSSGRAGTSRAMRQAGDARESRRPGRGGAGLTAREREVAALLAGRATNGEIAAALGVSPHTARHHTERVLTKLGLTSRRAVQRALAGAADADAGPQ